MKTFLQVCSTILVVTVSCTTTSNQNDALGDVSFDVVGSPAANALFVKGHLLMHSFEYDDAAEMFMAAQKEDSTCVMAYWGEAMTYNHPIWQEQDYQAGKNALMKLGKTSEERLRKSTSEMERDFLNAVGILYGDGTKPERDKAYADFMSTLYDKYPSNHEVASLYALSLLGSVQEGRDEDIYQKSARISAAILKENPNHPGALHYLIHADDDPSHAGEALFAANEYAVVAPAASHALHMPTHIFVALGMWDKVIELNVKSWQSSVDRMRSKKLSNDDLGYHSFYWLQYGYLQKGRIEEARKLLEEMISYCREKPSARARIHEVLMKSTYLVGSADWQSSFANHRTDVKDLGLYIVSREMFNRGMKSFHNGEMDTLTSIISQMKANRLKESSSIGEDGIAMCKGGSGNTSGPSRLDVEESFVMEMELEGLKAWKEGRLDSAGYWFQTAVAAEAKTSYSYGPPSIVKPSGELYGEFLLTTNRPEDAMKAFDACLLRAPKRTISLKGKMQAAQKLMLDDDVKKIEKELSAL